MRLSGLTHRLQGVLKTMADINWATFDRGGEETCAPDSNGICSSLPFRPRTCSWVYHSTIIRLKRIAEMATQQLLQDAYHLKTAMLELQHVALRGPPYTPNGDQ
ncbi:hypothetical protein MHU86_12148 [Fragilaria crotonensis]|nr:hypothetical protein MHU86_12148 [Fragilaria crotonensis]